MTNALIEIPAYTQYKYEMHKKSGILKLDRCLNQLIPANYGFIPDTLAEDGDPLDVFVITGAPLLPGSMCEIHVEGVFICTDNGISDHKIIATLPDGPRLDRDIVDSICKYLKTYKTGFGVKIYKEQDSAIEEI